MHIRIYVMYVCMYVCMYLETRSLVTHAELELIHSQAENGLKLILHLHFLRTQIGGMHHYTWFYSAAAEPTVCVY